MTQKQATQIYLIRHGKAGKAWHEDPNPGLSVEGRIQAESICSELKPQLPSERLQLFTSPLLRASETAEVFQHHLDCELITMPAFSEIPSPGIPLSQRQIWLQSVFNQSIGGLDEGLIAWRNEIIEAIQNIDRHTLVFSHFMVINCVVGWLNGQEKLVSFRPGYCSVTQIERTNNELKIIDSGNEMTTIVQ